MATHRWGGSAPPHTPFPVGRYRGLPGPGPWARPMGPAHGPWPMGPAPWPMGPGPWALAHGPRPMGPKWTHFYTWAYTWGKFLHMGAYTWALLMDLKDNV